MAQGVAHRPDGKVVFVEGALPFERASFEAVIAEGGRGVKASLKGFAEGFARATANELPEARIAPKATSHDLPASLGNAADDFGDTGWNNLAAGDVVGHEQRTRTADDDVVDDHADEIVTDSVVLVESLRDGDLRADTVSRGSQQWALEILENRDIEEAGESANATEHLWRVGRLDGRLHQFNGAVTGLGINPCLRVCVASRHSAILAMGCVCRVRELGTGPVSKPIEGVKPKNVRNRRNRFRNGSQPTGL